MASNFHHSSSARTCYSLDPGTAFGSYDDWCDLLDINQWFVSEFFIKDKKCFGACSVLDFS